MKRSEKADNLIRRYMLYAGGAGLIPISFLDVATVTTIQFNLVYQLAELYDVEVNGGELKALLSSLISSLLSRLGASAVKSIPVIGSFVGGISMAAFSAATTYAIGSLFKSHFENGGNLQNFDIEKAKSILEEKFKEGVEKTDGNPPHQSSSSLQQETLNEKDSIFEKLRELKKLCEEGVITEKEFNEQKQKLLAQL